MMLKGITSATSECACSDIMGMVLPCHPFLFRLLPSPPLSSPLLPSPSLPLHSWFSTVMYLAFLFCVIVVLLNLLIAQMSDTYTKLQDDVEGTFIIARARIIARLQKTKWPFFGKEVRRTASGVHILFLIFALLPIC